jgi:hypothetical protein
LIDEGLLDVICVIFDIAPNVIGGERDLGAPLVLIRYEQEVTNRCLLREGNAANQRIWLIQSHLRQIEAVDFDLRGLKRL